MAAAAVLLVVWMTRREPPPPPSRVQASPPAGGTPPPLSPLNPPPELAGQSSAAATSAPSDEALPQATCPLADHGFGPEPARRRVSSSWYTHGGDFATARTEQEQAVTPLLVYVYTDWCPYCKAFDRDLLSNATVSAYLEDSVVRMKINPESGASEEAFAHQLGVHGYPSVLLFLPVGGAPERLSLYQKGGGYQLKTPEEFVAGIERKVEGQAAAFVRRAKMMTRREDAIADYTRALQLKSGDPAVYRARALAYGDIGDVDNALDDLARGARLTPNDLAPTAIADKVLSSNGRIDEAIACWTTFIDANPSSGPAFWGRSQGLAAKGLPRLSAQDAEKACQLGLRDACRAASTFRP
jgi:tetratricopeptide (TPR) repeat protein